MGFRILCSVYFVYYLQYAVKSCYSSLVCLVFCEPRSASLTLDLGNFLMWFFEKKFPVHLAWNYPPSSTPVIWKVYFFMVPIYPWSSVHMLFKICHWVIHFLYFISKTWNFISHILLMKHLTEDFNWCITYFYFHSSFQFGFSLVFLLFLLNSTFISRIYFLIYPCFFVNLFLVLLWYIHVFFQLFECIYIIILWNVYLEFCLGHFQLRDLYYGTGNFF